MFVEIRSATSACPLYRGSMYIASVLSLICRAGESASEAPKPNSRQGQSTINVGWKSQSYCDGDEITRGLPFFEATCARYQTVGMANRRRIGSSSITLQIVLDANAWARIRSMCTEGALWLLYGGLCIIVILVPTANSIKSSIVLRIAINAAFSF